MSAGPPPTASRNRVSPGEAQLAVDDERDAVVGVPRRRDRLDPQAAGLDGARHDRDPEARRAARPRGRRGRRDRACGGRGSASAARARSPRAAARAARRCRRTPRRRRARRRPRRRSTASCRPSSARRSRATGYADRDRAARDCPRDARPCTILVALVVAAPVAAAVRVVAAASRPSATRPGAIGLAVPGAGPTVTRESGAQHAPHRARSQSSLLGGTPPGDAASSELGEGPPPDTLVVLPPAGRTENDRYPIARRARPARCPHLRLDADRRPRLARRRRARDSCEVVAAGRPGRDPRASRAADRAERPDPAAADVLVGGDRLPRRRSSRPASRRACSSSRSPRTSGSPGWWLVALVALAARAAPARARLRRRARRVPPRPRARPRGRRPLAVRPVPGGTLLRRLEPPRDDAPRSRAPRRRRCSGTARDRRRRTRARRRRAAIASARTAAACSCCSPAYATLAAAHAAAPSADAAPASRSRGVVVARRRSRSSASTRRSAGRATSPSALGDGPGARARRPRRPARALRAPDVRGASARRSSSSPRSPSSSGRHAAAAAPGHRRAARRRCSSRWSSTTRRATSLGIGAAAAFASAASRELPPGATRRAALDRLRAMRRPVTVLALLLAALALVAGGCSDGRGRPRRRRRSRATIPEETTGRQRRPASARADGRRGSRQERLREPGLRRLPHALGRRARAAPSGRTSTTRKPSYELVVERVTLGQGGMPSFGDQLEPQQIADVAAVRRRRRREPAEPPRTASPAPSQAFACDLDGTLIGRDGDAPASYPRRDLARAGGGHPRPRRDGPHVPLGRAVPRATPGSTEPVVCYQGAAVVDPRDARVPPPRAARARRRARGGRVRSRRTASRRTSTSTTSSTSRERDRVLARVLGLPAPPGHRGRRPPRVARRGRRRSSSPSPSRSGSPRSGR